MPVINNTAVASGTGLSTAGNGGRKLVRLANGALISAVRTSTTSWQLHKSTNGGSSWAQLVSVTETVNDLALASKGNDIHVLVSFSTTGVKHYRYNDSGALQGSSVNVDSGQSAMGNVSLAINEAGTELHAAWSSRNSNSGTNFCLRYAKATINGDGSVTWGSAETIAQSSMDIMSPSLVVYNGVPTIFAHTNRGYFNGTSAGLSTDAYSIFVMKRDSSLGSNTLMSSAWTYKNIVFAVDARFQYNPSAIFVPTAINGLANGRLWVAWHGKDATDSAKFNVRVSYSDDGGVTWATPVKLTSGNLYDRQNVSLAADKTGKVFALYEEHQWSPDLDIYMRTFSGGSWGAPVAVAEVEPAAESNPSALVDYSLQMTTPPFVFTNATDGIKFSGNLNVGASVSPASGALGNKETATLTAYTVTPEAGSTVTTIVEKVNGVTVNTFNNPASLSRTLTVPQATWDTLAYFASHTASVTVTDSNGAQTVTTYSFDKALGNGASLLEAEKANRDAKNRISQKRDALAAQVGLSAGSTFDAISAQLASGQAFKKFANGSTPVTSGSRMVVSGISFLPTVVIWINSGTVIGMWTSLNTNSTNYLRYASLTTANSSSFSLGSNATVTATGFSIDTGLSGTHQWFAFG